jgi:hypothetical protein
MGAIAWNSVVVDRGHGPLLQPFGHVPVAAPHGRDP